MRKARNLLLIRKRTGPALVARARQTNGGQTHMQEDIAGTGRSSAAPQLDDETYELVQELFRIVRAGEAARVAGLLRKGLVPNLCDGKGDSLLMLAAYHGHT